MHLLSVKEGFIEVPKFLEEDEINSLKFMLYTEGLRLKKDFYFILFPDNAGGLLFIKEEYVNNPTILKKFYKYFVRNL